MQQDNEQASDTSQSGLVISYFGNSVAVEAADGQVFPCHLRRNQELPVVGDKVRWEREGDETGVILGIEPRRSVLARGGNHGKTKPLAANVDLILVVMAPVPVYSAELVDRYTIAAEILGIQPVIVLNKVDLLDEAARANMAQALQVYTNIPYTVIFSSVVTRAGEQELVQLLQNKTSVLVGPSGVGKSSIISELVQQDIRTNDVSAKGTGKHTTTATRLYHLPKGGALIDSPGVRDFNLWPVSREEILKGFTEFKPYLSGCKFRDCSHLVEPGCNLQQALAAGKVHAQRFESFRLLMEHVKK